MNRFKFTEPAMVCQFVSLDRIRIPACSPEFLPGNPNHEFSYARRNDGDVAWMHFMNHTMFTPQLHFGGPTINPKHFVGRARCTQTVSSQGLLDGAGTRITQGSPLSRGA